MKKESKVSQSKILSKDLMPKGFSFYSTSAGIKKKKSLDLGLIYCLLPTRVFGVFTQNKITAAPVDYCKEILQKNKDNVKAVIVNSGNANACTQKQGYKDVRKTVSSLKNKVAIPGDVLVCSTGVIGEYLPMPKIVYGINELAKKVNQNKSDFNDFARSILTTDLVTKINVVQFSNKTISIAGVAKGSGMIEPNMATMLAFVMTDMELPASFQKEFQNNINLSFNAITVDGDMSTNDTALLLSNKGSGYGYSDLTFTGKKEFKKKLYEVFFSLAKQIVLDGEGATKLIKVQVKGTKSRSDAKKIAKQIANSLLVKTAFFGEDHNWGRIIAAIGSAGPNVEEENIEFSLFDGERKVTLFKKGTPNLKISTNAETQKKLQEVMQSKEITLDIHCHQGNGDWTVLTTDLSYDYVKINAEYHT